MWNAYEVHVKMHIEVHIHLFELYAYVDTYGGAYPLVDEMNMSSVVKEHRSNSWSFVLLCQASQFGKH